MRRTQIALELQLIVEDKMRDIVARFCCDGSRANVGYLFSQANKLLLLQGKSNFKTESLSSIFQKAMAFIDVKCADCKATCRCKTEPPHVRRKLTCSRLCGWPFHQVRNSRGSATNIITRFLFGLWKSVARTNFFSTICDFRLPMDLL